MSSLIPPLTATKEDWYRTEKNTSTLVRSVVGSRLIRNLSGDQIWSLITLTWITMGKKHVSPHSLEAAQSSGAGNLFSKNATGNSDLAATIDSMNLPDGVAQAAKRETGMVNFRGTWRNSSRKWCKQNRDDLRSIVRTAAKFPANDQ